MPKMEHQEFWEKIESFLRNHEETYTTAQWFRHWGGLTRNRRGQFIFLRFIFLIGLYVTVCYLPLYPWARILLSLIAGYLIEDMLMAPTALIFGGLLLMRPLWGLVSSNLGSFDRALLLGRASGNDHRLDARSGL